MLKNKNKNETIFSQSWVSPLCIFLVALCVFAAHRYQSSLQTTQHTAFEIGESCQFVNTLCEFLIDGQPAKAEFSGKLVPEESITITLSLPLGVNIESAWIEGLNMYMGKIPVLLENTEPGKWSGWFMLGSCTESEMKWQLRLNLKGQSTPHYLYFESKA